MEQNQNPPAKPRMPFWTAVKTCFKKYFDFKGRARRSEYWWFVLFQTIIYLALVLISTLLFKVNLDSLASNNVVFLSLAGVETLFFAIPTYAAQTRRLHDSGHSGWWIVASLVVSVICSTANSLWSIDMVLFKILAFVNVVIGFFVLLFTIQDSQVDENKYGPSPKYQ